MSQNRINKTPYNCYFGPLIENMHSSYALSITLCI